MVLLRAIDDKDVSFLTRVFLKDWGGDFIVTQGRIHKPGDLEGFIAEDKGEKIGLVTFRVFGNELEVISLNSFREQHGVGSSLLDAVKNEAKQRKLERIYAITTNDNLAALRFYQKRGFHLVRIYPNAVAKTRKLKPKLPIVGENGIPLRDEIELEQWI